MDFNSTVDIIIRDLNAATEIIDDLKSYPGVPALQVELAKSKCKSAAEVISLLKELKPQIEKPIEPEVPGQPEPSTPPLEDQVEETENSVQVSEIITETPEPVSDTPAQEPVHRQPVKKADVPIIADTLGTSEQRLNEQLGRRREESGVSEMIKSRPVANIARAIGINDKFLYIREIFNGDAVKYETIIKQIDSCADFGSACSILQSHTGDVQQSAVVKQLLELIRRKFPTE